MELSLTTPRSRHTVTSVRTNRFSILLVMAGLCLGWASASHAEIYKFVDDNGFVTYTNMPRPGLKPELVIPDATKTPSKAIDTVSPAKRKTSTRSSTPAYFPRVDTSTQRKRDDMRRQLLEEEMSSEQRNLAAAKSSFAQDSRQPGADLKKLMDAVRLHEKNIEMLNKELSHIR